MWKRTYLIGSLTVVAITFVVFGGIAQIVKDSNKPALGLEAKIIGEAIYSTKDIPIEIIFRNEEAPILKLLDIFDDADARKIFFTVNLRDDNGTPVSTVGGGKISISRESMKYLELKKDEQYKVSLNLKDFIPPGFSIEAGRYSVSIVYSNQYGKNCFKGRVESNTIDIYLNE